PHPPRLHHPPPTLLPYTTLFRSSANKMRSILTVLGVMIGVAAVIAVVSLVQGMQYKLSEDLQSVGSNYIEVFPDSGEGRGLPQRSEEHTSELQSLRHLVCRLLLE